MLLGVSLKCNLDQKDYFKTAPKLFKEYLVHLWDLQNLYYWLDLKGCMSKIGFGSPFNLTLKLK